MSRSTSPSEGWQQPDDELSPIRDAVRALCARFPGDYWREQDRERAYPTAFVRALGEAGYLGALIPEVAEEVVPEVLIVPLLAFDRPGYRLGYGGGFYDRTLERLRARGPVTAIGFAFAAQEVDRVPTEPTDQKLDLIVTERGVIRV